MSKIYGPYDQDDFRTMQKLKENIDYFKVKDVETFGTTTKQYRGMLKDMFQKAA